MGQRQAAWGPCGSLALLRCIYQPRQDPSLTQSSRCPCCRPCRDLVQHHPGSRATNQPGEGQHLCPRSRHAGWCGLKPPVRGFLCVRPMCSDCPRKACQEVDAQRALGTRHGVPPGSDREGIQAMCFLKHPALQRDLGRLSEASRCQELGARCQYSSIKNLIL